MNRALTAYSRFPNLATVVGTSKLGLVIAPVMVPLLRFGASATTAIRLSCSGRCAAPRQQKPSPLISVAPPRSMRRVSPVFGSMVKSLPVLSDRDQRRAVG